MATSEILKCRLGCGRVDDEIGKCGSFATCFGETTPVVPGVDVILTIKGPDQDTVRVINPSDVLRGKSLVSGFANLNENTVVTARVVPVTTKKEAPAFVPEVTGPKKKDATKATTQPSPEAAPSGETTED